MSFKKTEAGFQVIMLRGPRLLFGRPYYEPLLWFMINYAIMKIAPLKGYPFKGVIFIIA